MKLLIVESPAKAKTISKYLDNQYEVISSYGHVRGIKSKQGSVDIENEFRAKYEENTKSKNAISQIVINAQKADIIYLATDLDREGEAISWHIVCILKERLKNFNKKVQRISFQEITKTAVQKAISEPREINEDWVYAQQARQALDYLVGFTLSPVLWHKLPGSRSAGRVQSVALKIICSREEEIRNFKIEEYWTINGIFISDKKEQFTAQLTHFNGKKLQKIDITSQQEATDVAQTLKKCIFKVKSIETSNSKRSASPPFTTSTLIQEASHKLSFSANKTAKVAQQLYEGVEIKDTRIGLITYMRTDSLTISDEALSSISNFIKNRYGEKYSLNKSRRFKNKTKNAQEAHEAIRPTDINLTPDLAKQYLNNDQYKLYNLIWCRTVASQMQEAILENITAQINAVDNTKDEIGIFRATGNKVIFDGFYAIYQPTEKKTETDDNDKQKIPALIQGDIIKNDDIKINQHHTKPPARYNDASLVKTMEELGIGRPSTYPNIVTILQTREYVQLDQNKRFLPQPRGEIVNAFLNQFFNQYVCYNFTADLEEKLDRIAKGKSTYLEVLKEFWENFSKVSKTAMDTDYNTVREKIENTLHHYLFAIDANSQNRKCPKCNGKGKLSLRNSKHGVFIGCDTYPECDYSYNLDINSIKRENAINNDKKNENYPVMVGIIDDKISNNEIWLTIGPYGPYLYLTQPGSGGKKDKGGKNYSIPKNLEVKEITQELAQILISMPKIIGTHPQTKLEISIGYGRYGPYILHDKKFTSLIKAKFKDDFWNLTLDDAIRIINTSNIKTTNSRNNNIITKTTSTAKTTKKKKQ